ncbi:hypothetical protein J2X14_000896 [Pantoea alhagi]|uniref:hypothetical protein n=1 Tax=Mixta sp. BE291 TaxID=3158787 RepID=UPI002859EAE0|nr:hypothetical protein [Pantoea alhagi]
MKTKMPSSIAPRNAPSAVLILKDSFFIIFSNLKLGLIIRRCGFIVYADGDFADYTEEKCARFALFSDKKRVLTACKNGLTWEKREKRTAAYRSNTLPNALK